MGKCIIHSLMLSFFLLSGCEGRFFSAPLPEVQKLTLIATEDANNRSPIAVDVVLTRNKTVLTVLSQLSARDYFTQRKQLLRDYPHDIQISSWEVVPGQRMDVVNRDDLSHVVGCYVFADYTLPGTYRARLFLQESFQAHTQIYLRAHDFDLTTF